MIVADALQMRQLLTILIDNALKFRREEEPSLVTVQARVLAHPQSGVDGDTGAGRCELTVADNGIGFDEKYLNRIFNVFQRLHTRGEYEGSGMGLAIARKIIVSYGGEITARSKPGHGSTFVVSLPVAYSNNEETL